jgi:hypothetical protein
MPTGDIGSDISGLGGGLASGRAALARRPAQGGMVEKHQSNRPFDQMTIPAIRRCVTIN